jgi:hypothetical protein
MTEYEYRAHERVRQVIAEAEAQNRKCAIDFLGFVVFVGILLSAVYWLFQVTG